MADLSGLPPAVVETITQARAPSTRQTYALKWSLFANWRHLSGRHLQSCGLGDTEHLHKILQSPRWSRSLPVCSVTGNGREELAGVTLAVPFPLTRGYECLFSPPVQFPGRWTLVESSKHSRQSDWAEQSDARPSTGASSPGSPVSPCTGLGVRMAWFPFG